MLAQKEDSPMKMVFDAAELEGEFAELGGWEAESKSILNYFKT